MWPVSQTSIPKRNHCRLPAQQLNWIVFVWFGIFEDCQSSFKRKVPILRSDHDQSSLGILFIEAYAI